ncbi:putative addiction module component (TIGR02574 family) [Desulfitispora alkaliphila]|uniref:addiction module protein n=1 Tax=Desulfitispora alkaliphila TaxID=622674 RepID=UPI003D2207C9
MGAEEILKQALKLKPEERFMVVEGLIKSIDKTDKKLDELWVIEAEKRLAAYRERKLEGVPMEEIFKEEHRKPNYWIGRDET